METALHVGEEQVDSVTLRQGAQKQIPPFHAIVLVAKPEKPDGEEVRYEIKYMLSQKGCQVSVLLLETSELMNADVQQAVQGVISKGVLIMPIFTEAFVKDKACLNLLYSFIMSYMKRTGESANFFIPIYFDNPRKSRYVPILFCNFRGIWWERERDREMMVKIFDHYFGKRSSNGKRIAQQK